MTDDPKIFDVKERCMIYLQKDEDVFCKYADEEAELYYIIEAQK